MSDTDDSWEIFLEQGRAIKTEVLLTHPNITTQNICLLQRAFKWISDSGGSQQSIVFTKTLRQVSRRYRKTIRDRRMLLKQSLDDMYTEGWRVIVGTDNELQFYQMNYRISLMGLDVQIPSRGNPAPAA